MVSNPPIRASIKAVTVLAIAISMLICVAVRKNIVGFIKGEERINAITALKGTPDVINDSPIGIAAYVGKGEIKPIRAAEMMAMYSFLDEKWIFLSRKYRIANTFKTMLINRYGLILKNKSKKSSKILKV
jgi:hypothetical protein